MSRGRGETSVPTAASRGEQRARISMGPVLFNWDAEVLRDFYFRLADEEAVNIVYLGEVVCPKRIPFSREVLAEAAERLQEAGKEVVFSTLALVMDERDLGHVRAVSEAQGILVEANDLSAVEYLRGRRFIVGPFLNVYHEATLSRFMRDGAVRLCLAPELDRPRIAALSMVEGVEFEIQVFGRLPLALSARCYHARAYDLHKDNCQFVCGRDPDGMEVTTLAGESFVCVNGIQTMSTGYNELASAAHELREMGVGIFRLSPQRCDMIAIARAWRDLLDGRIDAGECRARLKKIVPGRRFTNGFFYGKPGMTDIGEHQGCA
ncbi:MAG: U32 family peptidase [Alphaproteobacteria bacterium]|nr:MAG: U32 family peptidase [Alphaproteobacteria bacterium]